MPAKKSGSTNPGVRAAQASTQFVPISPPSHVIRQQTGTGLPRAGGWVQGLTGAAVGAAIPSIMIGFMPSDKKWLGALISIGVGALGTVTSPFGTFIYDVSLASFAGGVVWGVLEATGNLTGTTASPVVMAEIAPDAFIPLPVAPQPMISPWEEYAV